MRLALLSLSVLSACGIIKINGKPVGGSSSSNGIHYIGDGNQRERVGPYWGPECLREPVSAHTNSVGYNETDAEPTMGKQPNVSHDPADQILRLVCVDTIMSDDDEPERNTIVMQHFRFDELMFDHFTASEMLVQCLLSAGSCLDAPHVVRQAGQTVRTPQVWQYYQAGMMRWYAERVDRAEVLKRVSELPLPPQAQAVYMQLFDRAKKGVFTFTDNLPLDAKEIFVTLPYETFQRRRAEYAKSGKYVTELVALTAKIKEERNAGTAGVSDETVDKLAKLRIAYEKTCKQDCTRGTIFSTMTKQLFWAHVSRGDAVAATAEAKLLDKLEPTAAQEIGEQQRKLIGEAQARVGRVKRAREQGLDQDTARSTAAGSITDFGDGRYVYDWHDDFKIYWESLLPQGKVGPIEGKVAAIDRRGKEVTIRFADRVSSWEEGTNCRETGRIESISRDGHITYREHCSGSTTKVERTKVEPVTMIASEASGIAPGDEVIGFTSFGPKSERVGARVWVVRRGQKLVRLRDVPL